MLANPFINLLAAEFTQPVIQASDRSCSPVRKWAQGRFQHLLEKEDQSKPRSKFGKRGGVWFRACSRPYLIHFLWFRIHTEQSFRIYTYIVISAFSRHKNGIQAAVLLHISTPLPIRTIPITRVSRLVKEFITWDYNFSALCKWNLRRFPFAKKKSTRIDF